MKNTFGTSVAVTLFGESHGEAVGAVIDGLAPGIAIDRDLISHELSLRRPCASISTSRVEQDGYRIVSGVSNGKTTGTPLCILIPNEDVRSDDYSGISTTPRPGHADYTGYIKYHGYADPRGGGHFSGRLTAALVAAGAVVISAIERKGIFISTHISRCAGIDDLPFSAPSCDLEALRKKQFAVISDEVGDRMKQKIEEARLSGDSVGGVLETMITGVPAGVGEPWFDTVEGVLSHALFSVPAVKGVEFGDGFSLADMRGSEANDCYMMRSGAIVTATNHAGGILGGITDGMPIVFRCAVKPTPSIEKPQATVDIRKRENASVSVSGRHDPAIVHRARAVVDCVAALVLCDLLTGRYGTDWLAV